MKKRNILAVAQGVVKALDLSPLFSKEIQLRTVEDDKKAIKENFNTVGRDLWRATDDFKEKYC